MERDSMNRASNIAMGGLVVILMLGVGCRDTIQAPPTARTDPLGGNYPHNVAIDGLHEVLVVEDAIVDESTSTRPMRVSVPVRSVSDRRVTVQYRFLFFDESGRELRYDSGWRRETIEPGLQRQFDATALQTAAADWRMEIRRAR